MFDGGLVTGTVLRECGRRKQVHREETARRDAPKLVCGVPKVQCCDVSRPVVEDTCRGFRPGRFSSSLTHGHDGVSHTLTGLRLMSQSQTRAPISRLD